VWERIIEIDGALFLWLREATRSTLGDLFFPWITDLDHFRIAILAGWLLLMVFGKFRGRKAGILLVVTLILTDQISSSLLKEWVGRVRPCFDLEGPVSLVEPMISQSHSPSFPSGHATNSVGGAFVLALTLRRWWWSGLILAGLISFSRIYVGVHYPLDVLCGILLGAGIALVLHSGIGPIAARVAAWNWRKRETGEPV
jgi:membrane-associated phospholipid phosphatase